MNLGCSKHLSVVLALQLSHDAASGINSQVSSYSHVHAGYFPSPIQSYFLSRPRLALFFAFRRAASLLQTK